jgi:hypothetical protein
MTRLQAISLTDDEARHFIHPLFVQSTHGLDQAVSDNPGGGTKPPSSRSSN